MLDSMRDSAKKYNVREEVSGRPQSQVSRRYGLTLWDFKSCVRKSARCHPQKIFGFPMRYSEGLHSNALYLAFLYLSRRLPETAPSKGSKGQETL